VSRQDSKRQRHRERQAGYVAHQGERPPPLSSGALRARQSRARRRAGLTIFHIEANERRVIAALRAANRLTDSASREDIERAITEVLLDFVRRWLEKKPCA
jgi:hypothetical protein